MCDRQDEHDHPEHPKDRVWEVDDPMLLAGEAISGDPELMMQCLVEEFASLGYDVDYIEQLFLDPNFQATAGLMRLFGPSGVRRRIERIVARCGTLRVRVVERGDVEEQAVCGVFCCASVDQMPVRGDDRRPDEIAD
jgi:hypothetical protein